MLRSELNRFFIEYIKLKSFNPIAANYLRQWAKKSLMVKDLNKRNKTKIKEAHLKIPFCFP